MSEIADTINDAVEHASESRLNSIIAALVAIAATFMALCNVKDGNIVQERTAAVAPPKMAHHLISLLAVWIGLVQIWAWSRATNRGMRRNGWNNPERSHRSFSWMTGVEGFTSIAV